MRKNIHGHGPLGDLYPDYRGGDIWSSTLGQVRGIKEGDTPSFLSLVPNGLSDPNGPGLGSWGGRFEGEAGRLTDVPDTDLDTSGDPDPRISSVYRWRPAFQADFAARLDWCVKPYAAANHPPVVRIAGNRELKVKAGDVVNLDASGTTDPDGDDLDFSWEVYPATREVTRQIVIESNGTRRPRSLSPRPWRARRSRSSCPSPTEGSRRLTRYGRVLVRVVTTE